MKLRRISVLAAAMLLAAPFAHANLVTNGNFETAPQASGTGWTIASPDGLQFFAKDTSGTPLANANNWVFSDGTWTDPNNMGTLRQTIATVIGTTYTFSFDLQRMHNPFQDPTLDNHVIASFGGEIKLEQHDIESDWTHFSYSVTATGTSTELVFSSYNLSAWNAWDNITVVAAADPDPDPDPDPGRVPEPATLALLGAGLLTMRLARQRS
ncbi:DUF642 domain-containing protein [Pseudoduganella sp. OTU4001]|uniref:DUF642 domain-containing protein n=1 Tax=Pseudoduganella sp. OTU4001 TaxID=3043854 RepID=UPI00313F3C40